MSNRKRPSFGTAFLFRILFGTIIGILLYIFYKLDLMDFIFANAFRAIFIFIGLISIISILINRILDWSALKSLDATLESMKKLKAGDFSARINAHKMFSPAPLIRFSTAFNTLAEELENIEMLRSDFINTFSHEFKTPIVSIRGFASILDEPGISNEKRKEYIDIITNESDRLAALATTVLNLSKIESYTVLTGGTQFEIGEEVRQAILLLEQKWTDKNLDIEINIDDVKVYGEDKLLKEVWLNILDNAIKFSKPDGRLIVRVVEHLESVEFSVRDFGCGMDEFSVKHMFDKFYQGDTSRASSGFGIGMSIVKKVIELHRGLITADSVPGEGTIVTVRLPKRSAEWS